MGKENKLFRRVIKGRYPIIKRMLDMTVAAIFIILLVPVYLLLFVCVKLSSRGPAIFWSERIGHEGKTFNMPKFRTMTRCSKVMSREKAGDNDIRYTPIGRFLRKTSLDELPQFWSVLIGDMSLIGPRPLLTNDSGLSSRSVYTDIYSVRPGITGLAQVNGRNFISPRNKSRYDFFYATRVCLWLDTKIAIRTIGVLFNTKNVM